MAYYKIFSEYLFAPLWYSSLVDRYMPSFMTETTQTNQQTLKFTSNSNAVIGASIATKTLLIRSVNSSDNAFISELKSNPDNFAKDDQQSANVAASLALNLEAKVDSWRNANPYSDFIIQDRNTNKKIGCIRLNIDGDALSLRVFLDAGKNKLQQHHRNNIVAETIAAIAHHINKCPDQAQTTTNSTIAKPKTITFDLHKDDKNLPIMRWLLGGKIGNDHGEWQFDYDSGYLSIAVPVADLENNIAQNLFTYRWQQFAWAVACGMVGSLALGYGMGAGMVSFFGIVGFLLGAYLCEYCEVPMQAERLWVNGRVEAMAGENTWGAYITKLVMPSQKSPTPSA